MTAIDTLFKNRKLKAERLVPFGFHDDGNIHTYSTSLLDDQFEMIVTITQEGKVSAEVIDAQTQENYVLHRVPGAQGSFVGTVRKQYEGVLAAIADTCYEPDVFKSESAKQVIRYVREKYGDELQFLWKRFSDNAVLRRQDNAKWYAALLILQKKKLGLMEDGLVEIIDLRIDPEKVDTLVDGKKYFPGYHMNKRHWFTMCLDGSVSVQELCRRIDESYALAAKK